MLTTIFVACVLGRFFFSQPLIVTSLAARISHFVTVNFHVFLPTKFVSFVLYNALPLSLLSTPVKTKNVVRLDFVVFSL